MVAVFLGTGHHNLEQLRRLSGPQNLSSNCLEPLQSLLAVPSGAGRTAQTNATRHSEEFFVNSNTHWIVFSSEEESSKWPFFLISCICQCRNLKEEKNMMIIINVKIDKSL
jgi:hypothetical protein